MECPRKKQYGTCQIKGCGYCSNLPWLSKPNGGEWKEALARKWNCEPTNQNQDDESIESFIQKAIEQARQEGREERLMAIDREVALEMNKELKKENSEIVQGIIKEEREKVIETMQLWRPWFYRDKITDEDIAEIKTLLKTPKE
jgi:hypothetical protein